MANLITSNRINVTIGYNTFSIPTDKVNDVIALLSRLQSIQVSEARPSPPLCYNGVTLIQD
jgi:hypothetical protein